MINNNFELKGGKAMFEIFTALKNNQVKVGKKLYHLYDCSGKEVIENEYNRFMNPVYSSKVYDCKIIDCGNGWYSLYTYPKK